MKRYSQTIANRLTKRVMLTVLAAMVVTASIVLSIAFRAIKAGADGRYQTMMNVVSEKLGRILLHEEICARNVFDAVNGNLRDHG